MQQQELGKELDHHTFIVGDPNFPYQGEGEEFDGNEDQALFNNNQVDFVAQQRSRSDEGTKLRAATQGIAAEDVSKLRQGAGLTSAPLAAQQVSKKGQTLTQSVKEVQKSPAKKAYLYKTLQQLSSSSDLVGSYVTQKFPNEDAIQTVNKNMIIKSTSTYKVFATSLGEGIILKVFSDSNAYMTEKRILTMIAMIYKGDEEHDLFPKILKSGYINEKTKKSPFLLLQSNFAGSPPQEGTELASKKGLTGEVGCCNMNEKLMKLEQCFDEVTIALIGIHLLKVLECLHEIGYIYGNNFALSNVALNSKHDKVSLFSFEKCMPYKDTNTGTHLKQERLQFFAGDAKFSSVQQMKMITASRRDDLINLMNMMIYFRTMDLPWCDYLFCMPVDSAEKTFKMVLQKKEQYTLPYLVKMYGLSPEFSEIAILIEQMKFQDYPNYSRISRLLSDVIKRQSEGPSGQVFQWKRILQHNKYSMIKIFSDEDQLMRINSDCRKENDSLNLDSQSEIGDPNSQSQIIDDEKMDIVRQLEQDKYEYSKNEQDVLIKNSKADDKPSLLNIKQRRGSQIDQDIDMGSDNNKLNSLHKRSEISNSKTKPTFQYDYHKALHEPLAVNLGGVSGEGPTDQCLSIAEKFAISTKMGMSMNKTSPNVPQLVNMGKSVSGGQPSQYISQQQRPQHLERGGEHLMSMGYSHLADLSPMTPQPLINGQIMQNHLFSPVSEFAGAHQSRIEQAPVGIRHCNPYSGGALGGSQQHRNTNQQLVSKLNVEAIEENESDIEQSIENSYHQIQQL